VKTGDPKPSRGSAATAAKHFFFVLNGFSSAKWL